MSARAAGRLGAALVLLSLAGLALAGLGVRAGWWPFTTARAALPGAGWGALAGAEVGGQAVLGRQIV
ncbi:hypothetical protein PYV61_24350, partial [Roseisolibacter sp. H3M3-2]